LDGLGKSTQAALLVERLKARLMKFPNKDTPTGKLIYEHLAGTWGVEVTSMTPPAGMRDEHINALVFQSLQLANRMEVATDIMKAAATGNVVFDRYWPSGYAYGKADGLDGEYLFNLHRWLPQPDLFILLDGDPDTSAARRPERRDRYEKDAAYLQKVSENYRELWKREGEKDQHRWVVLDAGRSVEKVTSHINDAIADWRDAQAPAQRNPWG
jgi:dTMP kinase